MGFTGRKEKSCSSSIKLLVMVMLLTGVLFVDETEAVGIIGIGCLTLCEKHCNDMWCRLKCPIQCIGHPFSSPSTVQVAPSPQQQRAFDDYINRKFSRGPSPQ